MTRPAHRFLCGAHETPWTMALIADECAVDAQRMLAYGRWDTAAEAQRLIDRRRAA